MPYEPTDSVATPPVNSQTALARSTQDIYRSLYEVERGKVLRLEEELATLQVQTQIYARDLSNVYQCAKGKRRELADVNSQLLKYASDLQNSLANLRKTNRDLTFSYQDTIRRLAVAAEFRDEGTGGHISRMAYFSAFLAEKAGLSSEDVQSLFRAAPMHDVGKIGIPDEIIHKPARLNTDEFKIMQTHTTIGADILANADAKIIRLAQTVALWHHERWDGGGYPHHTAGEAIPLFCRIASLADVFDALTSKRPYKDAFSVDHAADTIRASRERQFDPALTDLFLNNIDTIAVIMELVNSGDTTQVNTLFSAPL